MGDSLFLEQGSLRLVRRVMYYTGGHAHAQDYPDSVRHALSWRQADGVGTGAHGVHGYLPCTLTTTRCLRRPFHSS
jgi:hypothetical protein